MIDPRRGSRRHRRLGVIRNAQSRILDPAEIVGAVAGNHRVDVVEVEGFGEIDQRLQFRCTAENRLLYLAGEFAVADDQLVGAVLLKTDHRGNGIGEQREAAGDQAGIGAMGAHGHDELAAARRRLDARLQHFIHHADGHVLQERDALAQRWLELDLAAHGAFRDACNMRL